MTDRQQLLDELRPVAFAMAYRMLGSVSEAEDGVSIRPVGVNAGVGALFLDARQRLIGVVALDVAGGRITHISAIVNPDKLAHLGPVADYRSLRRSTR